MNKTERKKTAYQIALIIMSIYFSMLESMVPKPFPWIKLGFSNIATVIGMEKFGGLFGVEITLLRIFIYGFISGTLMTPGFIISITAGVVSALSMAGLFRLKGKFSTVAISTAGGVMHNVFQLVTVYFIFFRNVDITAGGIRAFVLLFIGFGTISGFIVGIVSRKFTLVREKTFNTEKVI